MNLKVAKNFWNNKGIKIRSQAKITSEDINPVAAIEEIKFSINFYTKNVFSVNVFLLFGESLVLVKENESFFNLVGGKVEKDETVLEAAVRETREEIGLLFAPYEFKKTGAVIIENNLIVSIYRLDARKGEFYHKFQKDTGDDTIEELAVLKLKKFFDLFENQSLAAQLEEVILK